MIVSLRGSCGIQVAEASSCFQEIDLVALLAIRGRCCDAEYRWRDALQIMPCVFFESGNREKPAPVALGHLKRKPRWTRTRIGP